jgi:lathosterol oxidase
MAPSTHHLDAAALFGQLRFLVKLEAQRYLVFVVLGCIAWVWWRRRPDNASRLQRQPIGGRQLVREIAYSGSSIVVFSIVSIVVMLCAGGAQRLFYRDIATYGWPYFAISILLMMLVQDTYFYWTHRLMHHRAVFRFVHRTHHLSTNPNPWTTYAIHPLEAVVDAGGSILILFLLPKHLYAYIIFMWLNTAYAVYGHLGHELVPAGAGRHWLGRWINTSVAHNIHHARARHNFGWYFLFWDRWMNTIDPEYEAQLASGKVDTPTRRASTAG